MCESIDRPRPSGAGRRRPLRRLAGDRRGVAALEFGLLVPFLIVLFGAVFETSMAIWRWHTVQLLADDATRVAAVRPTLTAVEVEQEVLGRVSGLDPDRLSLTINMSATGSDGGPAVAVTALYDHQFVVPDLLDAGGGITLSARTLMPVVQ